MRPRAEQLEEVRRDQSAYRAVRVAAAEDVRVDADRQAAKLRSDAERYVEDSLSQLSLTLQKLMTTVERGRDAAHTRRQSFPLDVYDRDDRR